MHIDETLLQEVGLDAMPAAEKQAFIEHAEEELEVRVGQKISAGLSDEQLAEFSGIKDPTAAASWLDQHVPDFRNTVLSVYQEFKDELARERQNILSE